MPFDCLPGRLETGCNKEIHHVQIILGSDFLLFYKCRGVITEILGEVKPMGGRNLPLLVKIGLKYLKI